LGYRGLAFSRHDGMHPLTRDLTEEELERNLQGELLYEVRQALGWVTVEELDI
jgi:hypothetical protein